jgi:small subunit ribosomal protein S16
MLTIRMQRTGRKSHAMFRVVVQGARVTPTSGKVVALLGSYDPHTKAVKLDKEQATHFLKNGAQPSDRVARLLKSEGVKLPTWVQLEGKKTGKLRNPEKLRKNQPKDTAEPVKPLAKEHAVETEVSEPTAVEPEGNSEKPKIKVDGGKAKA